MRSSGVDKSAGCAQMLPVVNGSTLRLLTQKLALLTAGLPVGSFEMPQLGLEPGLSSSSTIEARLRCPFANTLELTLVPRIALVDRPVEIAFATPGRLLLAGASTAESAQVARWIATHARLSIDVEGSGQSQTSVSAHVSVRSSGDGWIARTLVLPGACWGSAASVTVESLSLSGRPFPCDCLPAILRVGYNHTPAQAGAVLQAAKAGDVLALQTALYAAGSTEEADEVRERDAEDRQGSGERGAG